MRNKTPIPKWLAIYSEIQEETRYRLDIRPGYEKTDIINVKCMMIMC